jgi:hypothetical protein
VNGLIDFVLIIAVACLFVAGVAAYFRHHEIADAKGPRDDLSNE